MPSAIVKSAYMRVVPETYRRAMETQVDVDKVEPHNLEDTVLAFIRNNTSGTVPVDTMPPETHSNDFGGGGEGGLELISRFEFEFCRCVNYFLNDSNFWCVQVNVPWPVCAHAIPFRMWWLPRFMMT